MSEPPTVAPPSSSLLNEEVNSNDDLLCEVENYTGASYSARGAGPSSSGMTSSDLSPCYVCKD